MSEIVFQALAGAFLIGGALFCLTAALGIYRMPDVLVRMHASSKAGTLGCGMILLAVALYFRDGAVTALAIAAIAFILLTVPVAAHMIGRAAFLMGVPLWSQTVLDEKGLASTSERAGFDPAPGPSRVAQDREEEVTAHKENLPKV